MCKHVIYCFTKVIFTKHLLVWVSILFVCLFPPFWGEYVFGLYNLYFQKTLCIFSLHSFCHLYIYLLGHGLLKVQNSPQAYHPMLALLFSIPSGINIGNCCFPEGAHDLFLSCSSPKW